MTPEVNAQDPYTYKGTSVLVNSRDLRDAGAARLFENDRVQRRSSELPDHVRKGAFDAVHFRAIHQHLFQDVYSWAGEFRTVNLSKAQSSFARADTLDGYGQRIFDALAKEDHLRGLDKTTFVLKLTSYYAEVNAWHPFREGNGRTTRMFFEQVARNAGYRLDLRQIDKAEWNHAAERGHHGDLQPLKDIFSKAVRPVRALAFEVMERFSAIQRFPELQAAYDLYDSMTRQAASNYPNNRQAREHFAKQAKAHVQLQLDAGRVPNAAALNQALAAKAQPKIQPPAPTLAPRSRGR
jgi:cell filamentation protein